MKYALVKVDTSALGKSGDNYFVNSLGSAAGTSSGHMHLGGSVWLIHLETDTDFLALALAKATDFQYPYSVWYFCEEPTLFESKPKT